MGFIRYGNYGEFFTFPYSPDSSLIHMLLFIIDKKYYLNKYYNRVAFTVLFGEEYHISVLQ